MQRPLVANIDVLGPFKVLQRPLTLRPPESKSGIEGSSQGPPKPWWRLAVDGELQDAAGTRFSRESAHVVWTPGRHPATKALRLDGKQGLAECPDSADLEFGKGLTVATWFRSGDRNRTQTLLAKGEAWRLQQNGSSLEFIISGPQQKGSNRPNVSLKTEPIREPEQWHHVAATYDGKKAVVYLDGSEAAVVETTGTLTVNNVPISIGDIAGGRGSCWSGLLEDARVYCCPLTAQQVQALHQEETR